MKEMKEIAENVSTDVRAKKRKLTLEWILIPDIFKLKYT